LQLKELEMKNEIEQDLKLEKIVLVLQGLGMRVNEILELKEDDLIELSNGNNWQFELLKSEYPEFQI